MKLALSSSPSLFSSLFFSFISTHTPLQIVILSPNAGVYPMAWITLLIDEYALVARVETPNTILVINPRCSPRLPSSHCDFIIHTLAGCVAIFPTLWSEGHFLSINEHPWQTNSASCALKSSAPPRRVQPRTSLQFHHARCCQGQLTRQRSAKCPSLTAKPLRIRVCSGYLERQRTQGSHRCQDQVDFDCCQGSVVRSPSPHTSFEARLVYPQP